MRSRSVLLVLAVLPVFGPAALQHSALAADTCNVCGGSGRGTVPCPACGGSGYAGFVNVHGQTGAYGCTNCGGVRGNPFSSSGGGCRGSGQVTGTCQACGGSGKPGVQQLRDEARQINSVGVQQYKNKEWAKAVASFEAAIRKNPGDTVIQKNLENARYALRMEEMERERLRKEAAAASGMRQDLEKLGRTLDGLKAESVPGLDFDGTRAPGAKPDDRQKELEFVGPPGAKPAEPAAEPPAAPKPGWDDPNVVDLRDIPNRTVNMKEVSGGLPPASQARDLTFMVPGEAAPKPPDPPAAPPPSERVKKLSDADLDAELARTRRIFEKMRDGFLADAKELEGWARESQDAQQEAIKASLGTFVDLLKTKLGDRAKEIPDFDSKGRELQKAAEKLCQDLAKTAQDYREGDRDRQSRLEAAQAVLQSGYDFLSEADGRLQLSKNGSQATAFASFLVDYSYQATRWSVANRQIRMIVDNLDSPGGKLEAQKALARYHESLVEESKRRQAPQR